MQLKPSATAGRPGCRIPLLISFCGFRDDFDYAVRVDELLVSAMRARNFDPHTIIHSHSVSLGKNFNTHAASAAPARYPLDHPISSGSRTVRKRTLVEAARDMVHAISLRLCRRESGETLRAWESASFPKCALRQRREDFSTQAGLTLQESAVTGS